MLQTSDHLSSRPDATRRAFLKTSSATAAALSLRSAPAILAQKKTAPPILKIGLIGCGGRGTGAAAQALTADDGVHLHAMGDIFASQLERSHGILAKQFGERVVVPKKRQFLGLDAFQKILSADIDVVLLATPPGFRPQHLRAAVDAKKHVFCEKPMAVDSAGLRSCRESVNIAKTNGSALVSGFCWRYSESRRQAIEQIANGALGRVASVHATYLTGPVKPHLDPSERPADMSDVQWQLRNWYNYSWLSGDGCLEQACHSVDKVGWVLGDIDPIACTATGGRQIPALGGNIFDHQHVSYEFPNYVFCDVVHRQQANCHRENTDYIMGSKGACVFGRGRDPFIESVDGKTLWRWRGSERQMHQREHDELFASIRRDAPINDGDWMLHSTAMGIMARMAAYSGARVSWEDVWSSEEDLAPDSLGWDDGFEPGPTPMPGAKKA